MIFVYICQILVISVLRDLGFRLKERGKRAPSFFFTACMHASIQLLSSCLLSRFSSQLCTAFQLVLLKSSSS
jgi:hypothetical protein